jgi:hypothetical protein
MDCRRTRRGVWSGSLLEALLGIGMETLLMMIIFSLLYILGRVKSTHVKGREI